jgi:hypothetical protein
MLSLLAIFNHREQRKGSRRLSYDMDNKGNKKLMLKEFNMKFQKLLSIVGLIVLVGVAAGCSGLYTAVTATSASASGGTPAGSTLGPPITGTSVTSGGTVLSGGLTGSNATPGPVVTPTPLTLDPSGNLYVTLADNGGTVLMQVGQRFLLDLGDSYNWTFSIDNQSIVSRVPNILTIRGSQGLFEAHAAGTTVLHGAGDPLCRQSTPACEMPSIAFQIQITVQ